MKKLNLFKILTAGVAIVSLGGCKKENKPVVKKVLTKEIIDNTFEQLFTNSKLELTLSGTMENEDVPGCTMEITQVTSNTFVKKESALLLKTKDYSTNTILINKATFLASGGTEKDFADVLSSVESDDNKFTNNGDIYSLTKIDEEESDYYKQVNDTYYKAYEYSNNKEKYVDREYFGLLEEESAISGMDEILNNLIGNDSYDEESGCFLVNDSDIEPNGLSYMYNLSYKVKVTNGLISEFTLIAQEDPEEPTITEALKVTYGNQTITLPSENEIYVSECSHNTPSTYYRTLGDELYKVTTCYNCNHIINSEKVQLDENGKFEGRQPIKTVYVRATKELVLEIDINCKTNAIIDVDGDSYVRDDYEDSYTLNVGENTFTDCDVRYFGEVDNCSAIVACEIDGVQNWYVLKDATVNTTNKTITGTIISIYTEGEVLQ